MSYGDVVTREEAWFRTTVAGLPALLKATGNDGPFDLVEGYVHRRQQAPRQLLIHRQRTRERRGVTTGHRRYDHDLQAVVVWQRNASAVAAAEQETLDAAVERVVTRVRGVTGDPTHGGRFSLVAGDERGIEVTYQDAAEVLALTDQPGALGNAYVVIVAYTATEMWPA